MNSLTRRSIKDRKNLNKLRKYANKNSNVNEDYTTDDDSKLASESGYTGSVNDYLRDFNPIFSKRIKKLDKRAEDRKNFRKKKVANLITKGKSDLTKYKIPTKVQEALNHKKLMAKARAGHEGAKNQFNYKAGKRLERMNDHPKGYMIDAKENLKKKKVNELNYGKHLDSLYKKYGHPHSDDPNSQRKFTSLPREKRAKVNRTEYKLYRKSLPKVNESSHSDPIS